MFLLTNDITGELIDFNSLVQLTVICILNQSHTHCSSVIMVRVPLAYNKGGSHRYDISSYIQMVFV